jgi:hypothetical protein
MSATMRRIREAATSASPFERCVRECAELDRRITARARFGDARDEKLSKDAYLREALANGKTNVPKLRKLAALLDSEREEDHRWIDAFTAGVRAGVGRTDGGTNLRPVTGNLHMLMGASPEEFVNVLVDAMMHGTTALELVALAVLQVAESTPDAFGTIDDWDAHHARVKADRERRETLLAEIPGSTAMTDVARHHAGDGLWRLTYRWQGEDTGIDIGRPEALVQRVAHR